MKRLSAIFVLLLVLFQIGCDARNGKRWAVVNTSLCYLRAQPDYESALESQCLMGTVVEITGSESYWRKVNVPDYRNVWTNELVLAEMTAEQLRQYEDAPKWLCTVAHSALYSRPDASSARVSDFILGDVVRKSEIPSVQDGGTTWLAVLTASGQTAWVNASDVSDFGTWTRHVTASGQSLVRTAMLMLGTPYLWGGNTVNGFDCSGLVKMVYMLNGIVLPRNAREQIGCGVEVPYDLALMQPGDLIFYGSKTADGSIRSVSHVSMYIGGGKIIHSSQLVRINSIVPGTENHYGREAIAVRRMLGSVDKGLGVSSVGEKPWFLQ